MKIVVFFILRKSALHDSNSVYTMLKIRMCQQSTA